MTAPGSGVVRFMRATLLSGLVILLTAAAHRLGGGQAPGLFATALLGLALWPVALLATVRRLRPAALVAGLGVGQVLGHLIFVWLGGAGEAAAVSTECLQHATHLRLGHACLEPGLAAAPPVASAHAHPVFDAGPLMLAAHVAATVIAALLVARGERVLWRVLDLVARVLPVLVRPVVSVAPVSHVVPIRTTRPDRLVRAGRGPPAYAA